MTIGQFYDDFNKTHQSLRFRPFNEGVILGVLNWLMYGKEKWKGLIPKDDYSTWGIKPLRFDIPKPKPKDASEA